ncbi:hypothetical protein D9V86_06285 [Bacteroidetes/Chlorobi group bacterium ChocPot_Mid]|nr:MAG: hypothetical protein D9V86_06285 [Bacteroidetes/Chlorobi group bacterium ChocPot_Mid]
MENNQSEQQPAKILLPNGKTEPIDYKDIFLNFAKKIYPDYLIDNNNWETIQDLIFYFNNDSKCKYSLSKGIILGGAVGCGKTLLMNIFRRILIIDQPETPMICYSTDIIKRKLIRNNESLEELLPEYMPIFIDDIAKTNGLISIYGNVQDYETEIFELRYLHYTKNNRHTKTHFTTNLSLDDLKVRFDERVYTRMREMFNYVYLPGESRRK